MKSVVKVLAFHLLKKLKNKTLKKKIKIYKKHRFIEKNKKEKIYRRVLMKILIRMRIKRRRYIITVEYLCTWNTWKEVQFKNSWNNMVHLMNNWFGSSWDRLCRVCCIYTLKE